MEMFLPGSDLSVIEKDLDKIIEGLTKWEPKNRQTGFISPTESIEVHGENWQDAVSNMNCLFLKNLWSDGLPVVPPTEERVNWILTGTDLSPDTLVGEGRMLPKGGLTSIKQIAISLSMAGGRPEYLPVLIAAVEAMIKPPLRHQHWQATTASTYPAVIVNGPVAEEIRLNSGYGCLGPDPVHPAGATIGRALRLLQMNLGGALPGRGSMAIHGGANRYTNIVFAENETGLPADWKPLSVERGHAPGKNIATVHAVEGTVNIHGAETSTPEVADISLHRLAGYIRVPSTRYWEYGVQPDYAVGIALMGPLTAQGLSNLGYTKENVQSYIWENTKFSWAEIQKMATRQEIEHWVKQGEGTLVEGQSWPITVDPKNIMIVLSGGIQSGHTYWMQGGNGPQAVVDSEIKLPGNWQELLKKAEEDLGPVT